MDRALSARDRAVSGTGVGPRPRGRSVFQCQSPRGSRPRRGAARPSRTLAKTRLNKGVVVAVVFSACQHSPMSQAVDLRLPEILAPRLCPHLIGPLAAIANAA